MALQTIRHGTAPKKMTLETFAVKLLDKIINASSPVAIERYVAVAVRALGNKRVNGYIIQRFIDRVSRYLDNYHSGNEQQSANSRIARERLQAFRKAIAMPSGN
jgi:hypothetical protein